MKILITGAAGFIGSALTLKLLERGDNVIGIDNHNNYYDPSLKEARLERHIGHQNYTHIRMSLEDMDGISAVFVDYKPDRVVNLAAQVGVRYSIGNPRAFIDSNMVGFSNVLECCRHISVEHFVYASSSSVYGSNTRMPFSVHDKVDHPLSLYAATKKANELIAHTYSHIYQLPTTGLRFFTVYGPWDRPDMALQKFAKSIMEEKPIQLFNFGSHRRDFTYIDDIVEGIIRVLDNPAKPNPDWNSDNPDSGSSYAPWKIYNIGSNNPIELITYIEELEKALGKKSHKEFLPLQPGDVPDTYADIHDLIQDFDYQPSTPLETGIKRFVEWFVQYYRYST